MSKLFIMLIITNTPLFSLSVLPQFLITTCSCFIAQVIFSSWTICYFSALQDKHKNNRSHLFLNSCNKKSTLTVIISVIKHPTHKPYSISFCACSITFNPPQTISENYTIVLILEKRNLSSSWLIYSLSQHYFNG